MLCTLHFNEMGKKSEKIMSFIGLITGMVPKSPCKMAQDREELGKLQYHGRVWLVRCDGATLTPSTGDNT